MHESLYSKCRMRCTYFETVTRNRACTELLNLNIFVTHLTSKYILWNTRLHITTVLCICRRHKLIPLANKRFLRRTISNTLHANRMQAILSNRNEKSKVRRSSSPRKSKSRASSSKHRSKDSSRRKKEMSKRKHHKSANGAKTSKKPKHFKSKD